MNLIALIVAVICFALFMVVLLINRRLQKTVADRDAEAARLQQHHQAESNRISQEAQKALADAQKLIDEEHIQLEKETERIRQHYDAEARRIQTSADEQVAAIRAELEPLRKFENLREPEVEAQRFLTQAITEANGLREEAQKLLTLAHAAGADERAKATAKAKEICQQGEAMLAQATRDAGRILAQAEQRATEIGGEAYEALREKQLLEKAVIAIRNVIGGYGDRYIIPTRSLLDDLASDFGHTAAGESLKAAREQSRRMVEEGQAAECKYVEANRRETAIRFVIDAFNGRVDAILSRVKHDNAGTLEQEMRDAFNLVNLNGNAFRDARVLPAYLDARLHELKWAVVVQELRLREREEQQRIKEQIREEEKARREYERAIREAAKEEELLRQAMDKAQAQIQKASTEERAKFESQLRDLEQKLKEAEERNQRAISMAQQTKRGHVYIISNIGSFGENVYKIGLTRRLEPLDRIRELGDSSVPFEFDVHALIFSEDAPALETRLHKHFVLAQLNKVNHRKEFFRAELSHIRTETEKLGLIPKWTMTAAATEYRETLAIDKVIAQDPAKREAWVSRQLQLEVLDHALGASEEGRDTRTPAPNEAITVPSS